MSGKAFDSVLKELRRLGESAAALADSLEAIDGADDPAPEKAGAPRSDLIDPVQIAAWLDDLLTASAACVVKGDGFGPKQYRILPPTQKALEGLDSVRKRIIGEMEGVGI